MSSFDYVVSNAGFENPSGTNKFRNFVSLVGLDRESHSDTFTISGSLPEESYPDVSTGLSANPDLVIIVTSAEFGGGGGELAHSIGAAARGKQFGLKFDFPSYLGGRFEGGDYAWHQTDQIIPEIAEFSSFESDGSFILNVANPLGYDLSAGYFVARGGGVYDVGTFLSSGASGSQAITGLGFKPAAVMFFSAMLPSLGMNTTQGATFSIGAGDNAGQDYAAALLDTNGDIYNNSLSRPVAALLAEDANGAACLGGTGSACHPNVWAEATVTMDADGFTLHWTYNSHGARYISYIAFENAEVIRHIYNHTGADYLAATPFTVPTVLGKPKGLISYCTDLGIDTTSQSGTEGAVVSAGFCGADLSGQFLWSFGDVSRGVGFGVDSPFGGLDTIHGSFGCQRKAIGGFSLENIDCGEVVEFAGENFIVGMNYRTASRRGHRGRVLRPITNPT
jgi:hypothetical protein